MAAWRLKAQINTDARATGTNDTFLVAIPLRRESDRLVGPNDVGEPQAATRGAGRRIAGLRMPVAQVTTRDSASSPLIWAMATSCRLESPYRTTCGYSIRCGGSSR